MIVLIKSCQSKPFVIKKFENNIGILIRYSAINLMKLMNDHPKM